MSDTGRVSNNSCVVVKGRVAHHILASFVVAVLLFLWSFLVSENRRSSALCLPRSSSPLSEVLLDSNAISRRCCSTLLSGMVSIRFRYGCLYFVSIPGDVRRVSERIYRVLSYDDVESLGKSALALAR